MSIIEKDPASGMNAALSRVLRGQAREAGLSYEELALRVGVHKSTIVRVLKDPPTRHLDASLIEAICRVTGADVVEVWERAARRMAMDHTERDGDHATDVSEGAAAYARGRSAGRSETPLKVNPSVTRAARRR